MRFHICISIEGALKNWKNSEWKHIAKQNNCTVADVKNYFVESLKEGKRVLPFGEPCEGFSYETGCPGHELQSEGEG